MHNVHVTAMIITPIQTSPSCVLILCDARQREAVGEGRGQLRPGFTRRSGEGCCRLVLIASSRRNHLFEWLSQEGVGRVNPFGSHCIQQKKPFV